MRYLRVERNVLDRLLPGLDRALQERTFPDLEQPDGSALRLFKQVKGPALLIPTEHGGLGASPLDAVRIQRAIGSRSPSLAVATTMHHFSLASLVEVSVTSPGFEWMLLEGIARERLLVASGFAEGRSGAGILSPSMESRTASDGTITLSGSKKPCSLSRSMDLLTASVSVPDEGGEHLAVALIPAASPGIEVRPFWGNFALSGAESDEVVLKDVTVHPDQLVRTQNRVGEPLDDLQTKGFLWFELLITASYLGAASALVERVLGNSRIPQAESAALIVETESAMLGLEGVARGMHGDLAGESALAAALVARYSVQDVLSRVASRALELLGGMSFISSGDAAYLAIATHALHFHPPARGRVGDALTAFYKGESLRVA